VDLGTPDIDAAAAFYGAVFGWQFQSAGPDAGGYGMFTLDGKTVAAGGPLTEQGAAPSWTVYFQSADADATAEAVTKAGGSVAVAPMDVFTAGRMAQFADPEGASFAAWKRSMTRAPCAGPSSTRATWPERNPSTRPRSAGSPRTCRWATSPTP